MNLHTADFYVLTAFPGCSLWDHPDKLGMEIIDRNYKFFIAGNGDLGNIFSKEFPKEEVMEVHQLWQEVKNL